MMMLQATRAAPVRQPRARRPPPTTAFGPLKALVKDGKKPLWLPSFNKEKRRAEVDAKLAAGEPVIVSPDYTLGLSFLGAGAALNAAHAAPLGVPLTLLGALFAFQASQVKFLFDEEAMEVRIGEDLMEARENWAGETRE